MNGECEKQGARSRSWWCVHSQDEVVLRFSVCANHRFWLAFIFPLPFSLTDCIFESYFKALELQRLKKSKSLLWLLCHSDGNGGSWKGTACGHKQCILWFVQPHVLDSTAQQSAFEGARASSGCLLCLPAMPMGVGCLPSLPVGCSANTVSSNL